MRKVASKIKNEPVTDDTEAHNILHRAADESKLYRFGFFEDCEASSKLRMMLVVHHEWIGLRDVPAVLSSPTGVSKREVGASEWMRENSPPDLFSALEWATVLTVADQYPKVKWTMFIARESVDS